MSKPSLNPNYCSCIVNRARNLPNKGKSNGIDPFCTISMGKEKFVTAVCEKTSSPEWHEQCDMPIVDDATIKITVHHNKKNALSKYDFIGRAYVSLRDLDDYDRVHKSWYKLTNKEGNIDKDRGEVEVTLQFYSKNNTTGSVFDLSTKKKHGSLRDIKHALGSKLKSAMKHQKQDKYSGDNQLSDQSRRLNADGGSMYNVRDFLDDSASETTSYAGSHISLNSMSKNNNAEQKKKQKSRAPAAGLNSTPFSSHRPVTSDYDTSSILDSTSMYGGEEPATTATVNVVNQQQEVSVDENLSKKKSSNKTKRSNENDLTTIKENIDRDDHFLKTTPSKHQTDDELDFDNYFNQIKQSKATNQNKDYRSSTFSQSDDIKTPTASISIPNNPISISSSIKNQSDQKNDSTDDDVDEILGKLERASSMRSSVRRKIQPKEDIMQQSVTEIDSTPSNVYNQIGTNRNRNTALPDIVGGQKTDPSLTTKKPVNTGLRVMGYDDVKSSPITPTIRQELNYLDREELLHVIAYQADLLKRRDTRVKDLESYTDGLLVKIVEQCPTILQNGGIDFKNKR